MTRKAGLRIPTLVLLALALVAGAGSLSVARAETLQEFWHIPVWAKPGAWQDNTAARPTICGGRLEARADSLAPRSRTTTVRFLRNRRAEALPQFGGYRVYRCTGTRDTATAVLLRRYSVNDGDRPLWHFSRVDTSDPTTLPFKCGGGEATDSVLTFVDPDSSGALVKVCPYPTPGECLVRRDSIWAMLKVPGPHDGFRLWYTVTYEARNAIDNTYEDLFVPDTTDDYARCGTYGAPLTCPNLNNKLGNLTTEAIEATPGPADNLQSVTVVPNPFRGREAWDLSATEHEIHFRNLPRLAKIRIYTVSGDLVRELDHDANRSGTLQDQDHEAWDLKNADGRDVVSGIYMYRVEADAFFAQSRFVVIR